MLHCLNGMSIHGSFARPLIWINVRDLCLSKKGQAFIFGTQQQGLTMNLQ